MGKNTEIKVYDLEEAKKQKKIKSTDASSARVEEHAANVVQHNIDGISDEAYRILQTNPFLYNPNHQELKINSIEDYFIETKKANLPLGQVIRGSEFTSRKKKVFVKKAFKKWKKDFEESTDRTIKFEQEKNQIIGGYVNKVIGFYHYLNVILILILTSLIRYKPGRMWTSIEKSKFFSKISIAISEAMSISWYSNITLIIIYFCFISIFYISFYNAIICDLKKLDNLRQKIYQHSNIIINKEFKKKFRKTSRFYIRKAGKKKLNFSPMPIEKTAIKKVDLKQIEEITEGFIKKAIKIKKNKFTLNFFKYLFVYLLYVGAIAIVGYLINLIIMNIF